jgi:small subunit ribosomal protein S6e|tara:strand:+ start:1007 stop:1627 length:621 start_codon:yes stop_codon:yes gene_type:complete
MVFKINIGTKEGKTFKLEADAPALDGKELGQTVQGEDVSPDLSGYEFEITGASDKSGFTSMKEVEGFARKKTLLGYGKGMHQRPKGEKKVGSKPGGLRLRKTVRGKVISNELSQINLKLTKEGGKKLTNIFADQVKSDAPKEEPKVEEKPANKESQDTNKKAEPSSSDKVQSDNNSPPEDKTNPDKEPEEKVTEDKVDPDKEPTGN